MTRKPTIVFFLALLFLAARPSHAHGSLKFINGLWYDGTGFVKTTWCSVENVFRTSCDGDARVIDLGGRYVVPPLGDAHNHAFSDGQAFDEQRARFLGAGIFYVKNPNNTLRLTAPYRSKVNLPESVDVTYSNGGLTSTGGHPTQIYAEMLKRLPNWGAPDMEGEAYFSVDTPADVSRKWPAIAAGKPDFIKVYLEGARGLRPEVLDAVVTRAHGASLRLTAHTTSTRDFHEAVRAGVDEIAHLPLAPIDPLDADAAAAKKITVVTTVLSHRPSAGVADLPALHRANLAMLKARGVRVALGVDDNRLVIDELESVAALGVFTKAELVRLAVDETPRAIFPLRKIGRIADGYEASFITLDGNPLEDLRALRKIHTRVKQGHVLEIEAPKRPVSEALLPIVMSKGVDAAIAEYRRLEREEPGDWDFAEKHLNQFGYAMIQHGQIPGAIAIFALNAEKFPKSSNVYDSLGEAYMKAGDTANAILNYEKSLALNDRNDNARAMLNTLRR